MKKLIAIMLAMIMVFAVCSCGDKQTDEEITDNSLTVLASGNDKNLVSDDLYTEYKKCVRDELKKAGIKQYSAEQRLDKAEQYMAYINNGGTPDFDATAKKGKNGSVYYEVWISPTSLYRDYQKLSDEEKDNYDANEKMLSNLWYAECIPVKVELVEKNGEKQLSRKSIKKIARVWINKEERDLDDHSEN